MPFVHVSSNVAKAGVDVARAIRELSKSLSAALDRPEPAVMVKLSLDQAMLFAGSDAPCAFIQIRSIGKIDTERNPKTAQALTATVTELLGVPADRVFMNLDDIQITNWGLNGTTVDKLGPIPEDKLSSSGEFQECSGSGACSTAIPGKSSSVRPSAPSVSLIPDQNTVNTVEHNEPLRIVSEAQTHKRQARAKAFESNLMLTWFRCLGSVFSLLVVCTDIPRSGLGVDQHLTKYATLEPDVFKFFGPWHYSVLNTPESDAHQAQARVWSYKQDTTSKGLRALAKFFALSTFPACVTYQGPCSSAILSGNTVFEMLDSLVNATASMKNKKPYRTTTPPVASELMSTTLRSKSLYLDRLHQYLLPQVFVNPIWRTNRIFYYASHQLLPSSDTRTTRSLCFDFVTRPSFCQQLWSNFRHSCPESDSDCRAVGRIWEHTIARARLVQQMYPKSQVELTILESHGDLQFNKGGLSPTGMWKRNAVAIIRARQCGNDTDTDPASSCSTVVINEYRYEIGVVYSDALQWYRVVSWLRAMAQGYFYLRIAMLLKFSFDLTSSEDGDGPQPTVPLRVYRTCVLLLKMPVQAIIFGSPLPILLYAGAHIVDAAITYEVVANIFTSQNGFSQLKFADLCTVGFN